MSSENLLDKIIIIKYKYFGITVGEAGENPAQSCYGDKQVLKVRIPDTNFVT